jgi:phenol 2-monooxygenase (NADPH)
VRRGLLESKGEWRRNQANCFRSRRCSGDQVPALSHYHQGRIERILEENLGLHSNRSIVRSTRFVGFHLDPASDPDYQLSIEVEQTKNDASTTRKQLRSKYLVGADGAHPRVRQAMNLKLEGEITNHIWGVVDFIADTDFPDLRKCSAIHSAAGSIMVIPRVRGCNRRVSDAALTYAQIKEEVSPDATAAASVQAKSRMLPSRLTTFSNRQSVS